MKHIYITLLLIIFSFQYRAHSYFFSFAEMELNSISNKLEVTVIINSHDLEHWIDNSNFDFIDIEKASITDSVVLYLTNNIKNGFQLFEKNKLLNLNLIGFASNNDGNIEFYFETEKLGLDTTEIMVKFDLLMNLYKEQQNKLIFIKEELKLTYVFINNNTIQLIHF